MDLLPYLLRCVLVVLVVLVSPLLAPLIYCYL